MNIIEMAGEVDAVTKVLLDRKEPQGMSHDVFLWFLERFAALVEAAARADERKECAALCLSFWNKWLDTSEENRYKVLYDAEDCADAIRERGTT